MSMFMSLSENLGCLGKRLKPNARTLVSSTRIFYFQILQYSLRLSNCNYSYEADFILKKNEKRQARSFNFRFRYLDDVLSLNNSRFDDFVDRIYPIELEIKDSTDTDQLASYIDLLLEIDSEGRLRMKLYNKRDDFNFPIVNFSFIYIAIFQQHLHISLS